MKNSEEAIENVLAGLRNVEAPEGMERRILNSLDGSLDGLRDGESRRSRSGSRQVLPIWLGMPALPMATREVICGVALAGAFVLAVMVPAMRRVGRPSVESKGSVAPVESMRGVARMEERTLADSKVVTKSAPLFSTGPKVQTGPNVRSTEEVKTQRVKVDDMDALALEEMNAASQPAPPLPLTKQEKLLLRVAHRGGPDELAALDPARRAAQDKEERAEVERFFEPKTAEANE